MLTSAKAKTAIAITALIALVIGALAWFFLISPKFEEASDINDQAQSLEERNKVEAVRIQDLKARFDRMDEIKDEIAGYQVGIPVTEEIDAFVDYLVVSAADLELAVVGIGFAPSSVILATNEPALPPSAKAALEAQQAAAAEADSDEEDDSAPAVTAPALIEGFYGIEVETTVIGPKENVFGFLDAIQEGSARHNLIFEFQLTSLLEGAGSSGRPDIEPGDVELAVTGMIYVLRDPYGIIDQPPAAESQLQGPGAWNPFVPFPDSVQPVSSGGSED